jgi:hypothetical protein
MQINTEKFNKVVEAAKAKTSDPKWLRAIEKAAKGILDGSIIVTVLAHGALVTGPNGSHHANGACDCAAAKKSHAQCYHRAAARLMHNYETAPEAVSFAEVVATKAATSLEELITDVAASPRQNLISEITNIWPRFAPELPLATELLARFGKSKLEMLDDDALRRVRLAVAL